MKKIHLTIGMIIIIVSSFAQSDLGNNDYSRFEIGLNQTPTLFKYNNRQEKLDFSQIIGIRSDYSITKKMSIQTGIDYMIFEENEININPGGNIFVFPYTFPHGTYCNFKYKYLQFPINIKIFLNKRGILTPYFLMGMTIIVTYRESEIINDYIDSTITYKEDLNHFDNSLYYNFAVGIKLNQGNKINFKIEPTFKYRFGDVRYYSFGIGIGICYNFKSKISTVPNIEL